MFFDLRSHPTNISHAEAIISYKHPCQARWPDENIFKTMPEAQEQKHELPRIYKVEPTMKNGEHPLAIKLEPQKLVR